MGFLIEEEGPFDPAVFEVFLAEDRASRRFRQPRADLGGLSRGQRAAIRAIRAYRREISPRLGRQCVFDLTCSSYAELAIAQNGLARGTLETWQRLRRCRPENEGQIDYPKGVPSALPSDPDRQELQ
jgi:putative membrane protein insertion efficiency factor